MTAQHIVAATAADVELEAYALDPESIVAGDPRPRIWSTSSDVSSGEQIVSGLFDAQPGTIRNPVRFAETVHVLEGRVRIELDTGEVADLGPGDVATLLPGPMATWVFTEPFREFFVLSGVTR